MSLQSVSYFRIIIVIFTILCSIKANSVVLPHKLHYVWVGNKMPQKYIDNIADFAEINSDYEVIMWTDRSDLSLSRSVKIKKIEQLFSNMPKPLLEYLFHEMQGENYAQEGLVANYAAASDILRIEILKREGGIYLDTDVRVLRDDNLELSLESGKFGNIEAPLGYLVPIKITQTSNGYISSFNNYMMGALPEHPILTEIENTMMANYAKFLVQPDLAPVTTIRPADYGLREAEGNPAVRLWGKIHVDNFWSLKLAGSRTYTRYVLTHETTGLNLFHSVFLNNNLLKLYYKNYVPNGGFVSDEDMISFTAFPEIIHTHHDNKVLWWENA